MEKAPPRLPASKPCHLCPRLHSRPRCLHLFRGYGAQAPCGLHVLTESLQVPGTLCPSLPRISCHLLPVPALFSSRLFEDGLVSRSSQRKGPRPRERRCWLWSGPPGLRDKTAPLTAGRVGCLLGGTGRGVCEGGMLALTLKHRQD